MLVMVPLHLHTLQNLSFQGLLNVLENTEDNPNNRKFKRILEGLFDGLDVINEILKIEPLFITKTAEELQWGYEDPIFKLVHAVDPSLLPSPIFSLRVRSLCEQTFFIKYQIYHMNSFAIFYHSAKGPHSVSHCYLYWYV